MKFIELFAGIGGFRLGLERAGHECIYANEWSEKPASIYEKNFREKPDTRDIRTIDPVSIPDADLICGGFPCATFSIAGKRQGIFGTDTRGTLFFEICRFAEAKRAAYILLENVKGLLNHEGGRTFAIMLFQLDKLGYDVQWQLLDSRNFGVPQFRERLFIVANLRTSARPKVFPFTWADKKYSKGKKAKRGNLVRIKMRSHTKANMIDNDRLENYIWTLDASPQNKMAIEYPAGSGLRKLTPLECERLQGLPDNFTKYYADGNLVEDSERYERCGRTVTIQIIEEIGKRLFHFY